jgi:hypothetical protein
VKKIAAPLLSWFAVGCYWCVVTPASKSTSAIPKSESIASADSPDASVTPPISTIAAPIKPALKSAKRLKIQVDVTRTQDLKIREGQRVSTNQLIADYREPERIALKAELDRVKLSIEQLKLAPKVKPIPRAKVKSAQGFTKPSYAEEEAAIATAKSRLAGVQLKYQQKDRQAQKLSTATLPETVKVRSFVNALKGLETDIHNQEKKIEALRTIEVDPGSTGESDKLGESNKQIDQPMQDHEHVTLAKLQQSLVEAKLRVIEAQSIEQAVRSKRLNLVAEIKAEAKLEITNAQRDVDTAHARLAAAVEKTEQVRSDRQVAELDREDRVFRTELERIKLIEVANLQNHDREYQLAQLQLKKSQLQSQIREIKGILAPFDGTVRRVKLVAQQGNVLRYEVGIMYAQATVQTRSDVVPVPQWQEEK